MAALVLPSRLTKQPQYSASLDPSSPGARGLAWLSYANTVVPGATGCIRDVVSGRTAALQDSNNYLTRSAHALGWINTRFIGSNEASLGYTGPVGLLNGATELTLFVSFVFRSGANSAQWDNFYVANQHTLSVFSQTSSSVTFGVDWAGAWNGTSTQTVSNLNDGDVVMLLAVVNQSGARLFAAVNQGARFLGTKSGSGFTVSSAANTVDIVRGIRGDLVLSGAIRRAMPDAEALTLLRNQWQLLKAPASRLWVNVPSGGGAHNLVGANSSQANVSASGAITQVHTLAAAASVQANDSAAAAITQTQVLAGANAAQANVSLAAAIIQTHLLAGAVSTQDNNTSTGQQSQVHVLAGSPASQANNSATGGVTQAHQLVGAASTQANDSSTGEVALSGQLAGAPSTQANVSASGAITQVHQLSGSASTQSNTSGTGAISIPRDPRYARPQTDMAAGSWTPSTGTSLAAMLDEPSADSTDFISATSPSICRIRLNPVTDPGTSSGQVVRYQAWADGGGLKVRLYSGGDATLGSGTLIAEWPHASLPTTPTVFAQTLTAPQCDSITDYTNLFFEFEAS